MESRGSRLVTLAAIWAAVVLQTFEVATRRFRSKEIVGIWLTPILLAAVLAVPDRRWPLKVRVPIGSLMFCSVGYSLYLTGSDLMLLGALEVILPILVWLALRRFAPWPWVKGKWALVGLLGGGIAIGCWLSLALNL